MKLYTKMFKLTKSDYYIGGKNYRLDCGLLNVNAVKFTRRLNNKFLKCLRIKMMRIGILREITLLTNLLYLELNEA